MPYHIFAYVPFPYRTNDVTTWFPIASDGHAKYTFDCKFKVIFGLLVLYRLLGQKKEKYNDFIFLYGSHGSVVFFHGSVDGSVWFGTDRWVMAVCAA